MTTDVRQELRYYIPLIMGFAIMIIALLCPPIGSIPSSAIYGSGCFLILAGTVIGLNVPLILHEINEMKRLTIKLMLSQQDS